MWRRGFRETSFVRANIAPAIVNDYCKSPRGTREVAITGLPTVELCIVRRRGFDHRGADELEALIRATV